MASKKQELVVEVTTKADQAKRDLAQLDKAAKDIEGKPIELDVRVDADQAKAQLDTTTRAAGGAKNAFANLVGNTSQDLGNMLGPLGSVGVAIGQVAEYTADAANEGGGLKAALSGAASMVGPLAALSLATLAVTDAVQRWKARQAELKQIHEESVQSFIESTGVIEDWGEALDEAFNAGTINQVETLSNVLSDRMKPDELNRVATAFGRLGLDMKDLGKVIPAVDENFKAYAATILQQQGLNEAQAKGIANLIDEFDHFTSVSKDAAAQVFLENVGPEEQKRLDGVVKSLAELADQAQNVDLQKVSQDALDAARAFDAAGVAAAEAGAKTPLEAYQRYTDQLAENKRVADENARAQEEGARLAQESGTILDQVSRQVEEAYTRQQEAIDKAKRAQDEYLFGIVDLPAETDDVTSAIARMTETLVKNTEETAKGTQSAADKALADIALADAERAVVKEATDVINTYKDQGLSSDQARAAQEKLATQAYDTAIAFGYPAEAAQAIADKVRGIPPTWNTDVEIKEQGYQDVKTKKDDLEKDTESTHYIYGVLDRSVANAIANLPPGSIPGSGRAAAAPPAGLAAAPMGVGTLTAPAATAAPSRTAVVNVNLSGAIVADTFQLQRVVSRAVRQGVRLNGARRYG